MKKRKVEAEEVLRPFISLKERREGPFGAGGVLDEGGKGVRLGAIKMVKLRKLGGKAGTLMDFRRTGRLGGRFRVAAAEQKLRSVKLEIV